MELTLPTALLGIVVLLALIRLFTASLRLALKLAANTLLGFGALWLSALAAPLTGIALGINLFNALVIGILGLPGFLFLLLAQWVLAG